MHRGGLCATLKERKGGAAMETALVIIFAGGFVGLLLLIVLGRFREMREETRRAGLPLGVREASTVWTLSCLTPLPKEAAAARLLDGLPAGGLVCAWDQDRRAYAFRSELPDGSVPLYCTAEFTPAEDGTVVTLHRQKNLLSGNRDVILRMSGHLQEKLEARNFSWL